MAQLKRGARSALDEIGATLTEIDDRRQTAHRVAISNPQYTRDKLIEIGGLIEQLRYQLRDLEPLLERQAPQLEARVLAIEEKLRAFEDQRIVPFRKEA